MQHARRRSLRAEAANQLGDDLRAQAIRVGETPVWRPLQEPEDRANRGVGGYLIVHVEQSG